ncbi:hypothetical protein GS910_37700 [Paraburkholderia sp. RL16-012-BIC-B]|nr:hypothetical protein [Paraburkholderia madseniana]
MKTRSVWCKANVTHLMKVVEVMEVMETVDKDKAHARANEYRRPPPPGVGIGIGRGGVPQHAAILALNNLPGPITLQARTSDDLLHRPIDFRLPDNSSAIRAVHAVGRHRLLVIRLRECRRSEAETDEQCPETKQFVHDVWPHESPTFSTSCVGVTQHIGVLAQIHVAGMAAIGACRSRRGCLTSKRWNMPAYSSNTCSLAFLNSVIRVRSQANGDDLPDGSNNRACGEYDVRNRWQQPTYQSTASTDRRNNLRIVRW